MESTSLALSVEATTKSAKEGLKVGMVVSVVSNIFL